MTPFFPRHWSWKFSGSILFRLWGAFRPRKCRKCCRERWLWNWADCFWFFEPSKCLTRRAQEWCCCQNRYFCRNYEPSWSCQPKPFLRQSLSTKRTKPNVHLKQASFINHNRASDQPLNSTSVSSSNSSTSVAELRPPLKLQMSSKTASSL